MCGSSEKLIITLNLNPRDFMKIIALKVCIKHRQGSSGSSVFKKNSHFSGGKTFRINFNTFNLCVKNLMMM